MFDKPFLLKIITPTRVAYEGEVLSVSAPGVLGGFQVLHNHAPLLSALEIGELNVRGTDGREFRYTVSGGFLEVKANSVAVLVDTAEQAPEIDQARATRSRDRAQSRLHSKDPSVDIERARLSMLRALNRLRAVSRG